MIPTPRDAERLLDLLAERELSGLSPAEARELAALLDRHGDSASDALGLAAAEICRLDLRPVEPLPPHLEATIAEAGRAVLAARRQR